MKQVNFTYLITVHNKEDLLERVLNGVAEAAGRNARIVPILDGCTDGSEAIALRFAKTGGIETKIAYAPDVHEIKSINIGLKEILPGSFVMILQDDVVLAEKHLEAKVKSLHDACKARLGYLSFHLGVDIEPSKIVRRIGLMRRWGLKGLPELIRETNYLSCPSGHNNPKYQTGEFDTFYPRMAGIKSPVCLTPELMQHEPFLDEALAPYCYDDVDMSLRAMQRKLINGVLPIRFESKLEWGGTRKDPLFSGGAAGGVMLRNKQYLWRKHRQILTDPASARPAMEPFKVKT